MGLFKRKQKSKKKSPVEQVSESVIDIFDDSYREELRQIGRDYFKEIVSENADVFKHELDNTLKSVTDELKDHMAKRLEFTVSHINKELSRQLNDRLAEYDRLTKDAHDLSIQSLNRNAHALHERYQQLSASLQQTVASQEANMIGVFEENNVRVNQAQAVQEKALRSLHESAKNSKAHAEQAYQMTQKAIADHEAATAKMLSDNNARLESTNKAHEQAIQSLNDSVRALQDQYLQLSTSLQQTIADQKKMMIESFQSNMAQIIEHYLLGAMAEQYDMKAQLPMIIEKLQENKDKIADDMRL